MGPSEAELATLRMTHYALADVLILFGIGLGLGIMITFTITFTIMNAPSEVALRVRRDLLQAWEDVTRAFKDGLERMEET